MKEIDMKTYPKRNQFHWFSTFPDPTYGFDVEVDVTALVKLSKERKESFFPYFLFAVIQGINSVREMRMREVNGKVFEYDRIHPTFTVMSDEGVYQNCGFELEDDFHEFYLRCKETIEEAKHLAVNDELDRFPICKRPDVAYMTCIPFLDYKSMTHPTPSGNHDSLSVPRVCWDQYHVSEDGRITITLNITVSHTLVDGFPLGSCFKEIQRICKDISCFE